MRLASGARQREIDDHLKPRASIRELKPTAMYLGDRLDQIQPQPVAGTGARRVSPRKTLRQQLPLAGRDAGSIICDAKLRTISQKTEAYPDMRSCRGVSDRVFQQVDQRLRDQFLIAEKADARRDAASERFGAVFGNRCIALADACDCIRQVERPEILSQSPGFDLCYA